VIQRGDTFYFQSPVEILSGSNAATPQCIDVSPWVPAEALSYRIACPLFHAMSDQYGNADIALLCRLPGSQGTPPDYADAVDFGKFAQIADAGLPPNTLQGRIGATLEIPNMGGQFYWLPRGNSTINGAQAWLWIVSYRMPTAFPRYELRVVNAD
jgi:hypothetical protein